jgi:hypothetical protein|tara:strand:- start:302 stop:403 length:102 start_codon:yes stop_codon:yes gene_type:complete
MGAFPDLIIIVTRPDTGAIAGIFKQASDQKDRP